MHECDKGSNRSVGTVSTVGTVNVDTGSGVVDSRGVAMTCNHDMLAMVSQRSRAVMAALEVETVTCPRCRERFRLELEPHDNIVLFIKVDKNEC